MSETCPSCENRDKLLKESFQALGQVEWVQIGRCWICPECRGKKPDQPHILELERAHGLVGHKPGCFLFQALHKLGSHFGMYFE